MFALLFLLPPVLISLNAITPNTPMHAKKQQQQQHQQQQQQHQQTLHPTSESPTEMSTQPPSNQTDSAMPIFLVSASGTTCAEATPQGIRCNSASETNPAQQWTVERDEDGGDTPDTVAFKNMGNGEYLFAEGGNAGAQMSTSRQRQFWTLEKGTAAAAYWLKCEEYPNAYLKNDWGRHGENNKVLIWKREEKNRHTSVWYLQAVSTAGSNIPHTPTASEGTKARHDSLAAQEQELENLLQKQQEMEREQEKAMKEKEKVAEETERQAKALLQKQKVLAGKEQQLADLEQDINWKAAAAKEEDLKELARKRAVLKKRERVLFAAETAQRELTERLEGREKELVRREEELQHRLSEISAKERGIAAREASVDERERRATAKPVQQQKGNNQTGVEANRPGLAELAGGNENADASSADGTKQTVMEKEALKKQVQHLQKHVVGVLKSSTSTTKLSTDAKELSKLRNENSRLKDHIVKQALQAAKVPDKKAEMERLKTDNVRLRTQRDSWKKQAGAARPAKEVPNTTPQLGGAKRYDCGHVIYPAPRKIEKKCKNFVGYMYED